MIRAIWSITHAAIRHAWYTRAILWLLMAACAPAVLLPLNLKSDGSLAGTQSMILTYVPIAIFAILLVGSIWIAAYALAAERLHLQFAMLKTKPVSGMTIWLGKWLAVGMINCAVITVSGLLFYGMLSQRIQTVDAASRTFWQPYLPDETEIMVQAQSALPRWSEQTPHAEHHDGPSLEQLFNRLRQQKYRVAPGQTANWQIPLPHRERNTQDWRVVFRWQLDPMRRTPVSGTWTLLDHTTGAILATQHIAGLLDGNHTFTWNNLPVTPKMTILELRFHAATENEPNIFFDIRNPLRLEQRAGSLSTNLLRAAGIALIFCAALSAVALLFSACLSFPVTVFATHGVMLALLIAAVAGQERIRMGHNHGHDHGHSGGWLLDQTGHFLDWLHAGTRVLREILPFSRLSANIQITWQEHAGTLLVLALLFPLLCGALAHLRISREEVPQ